MSLNYTPLRHKMLKAIDSGQVRINDDASWSFGVVWESTRSQMARACNWLWHQQLIGVYREQGRVEPSDAGFYRLAVWTSRHGEPT